MARSKTPEELIQRAELAIVAAWGEGCPVAGPPHDKAAKTCIRRWRSFSRRGVGEDRDQRVRDMAKGLVAVFENRPDLVGPVLVDYEYLAERVLDAIET